MPTDQKAPALSPRQQFLSDLWDEHLAHEFAHHDTEDALDTMIPGAHVNLVVELVATFTHIDPDLPSNVLITGGKP